MKVIAVRAIAVFCACFLFVNCVDCVVPANEAEIFDSVIRFHVIAESDTSTDQEVKLLVRDAVLSKYGEVFVSCDTFDTAYSTAKTLLESIQDTANDVLTENGFYYSASVYLDNESYPTRKYGEFALPSGEYCSLRIVLGSGNGQNWWCVLFPPICTSASKSLSDTGIDSNSTKVFTNKKYIFRFKFLELFW